MFERANRGLRKCCRKSRFLVRSKTFEKKRSQSRLVSSQTISFVDSARSVENYSLFSTGRENREAVSIVETRTDLHRTQVFFANYVSKPLNSLTIIRIAAP